MGQCEVIKTKVVALDEIFHLSSGELTVKPGIDLRNAVIDTATAQIKVCVVECGNFRCECGKVKGTITFAICEDFTIVTPCGRKPVEYFFRLTKDFTFQKSNCSDLNVDIRLLKCQIERVLGTNTVAIVDDCTFTQKIDIEVKIVAETEKILCVALCQDIGTVNLVTPAPTTQPPTTEPPTTEPPTTEPPTTEPPTTEPPTTEPPTTEPPTTEPPTTEPPTTEPPTTAAPDLGEI